MLNVQRNRGASQFDDEVAYTRKWLWMHMILGAVMVVLFLFYEVFDWFAGAAVWYALSLVTMYGFMLEQQACRLLLALLFSVGAGAAVWFNNRIFPSLSAPQMPIVPPVLMPFIIGLCAIAYAVAALCLLFSARIRRAGSVGFSLW